MASSLVGFVLAGIIFWIVPFIAGLLLGYKLWYKKESKMAIFDLPPKKVEILELPPPRIDIKKKTTGRKRKRTKRSKKT